MTLALALVIAGLMFANAALLILARAARMGDEMAERMERPGPVPGEWVAESSERGAAVSHPEDTCERCGGANVVWFAPNDVWQEAIGRHEGIVCPSCFVKAHEAETGRLLIWSLMPQVDRTRLVAS